MQKGELMTKRTEIIEELDNITREVLGAHVLPWLPLPSQINVLMSYIEVPVAIEITEPDIDKELVICRMIHAMEVKKTELIEMLLPTVMLKLESKDIK